MYIINCCLYTCSVAGTGCNSLQEPQPCNKSDPDRCNCRYLKPYDQPLDIPCFDSSGNCNWYHRVDCALYPFQNMTNTNGINLPGYFDPKSYGIFTSNTSNGSRSCYYAVIPPSNLGT